MNNDAQEKIAGLLDLTPLEQTYLESCMGGDDVSAHKTGHSLVRKLVTALLANSPQEPSPEKDAAARLAARLRAMFADTGHSQVIDGHRWWSLSLQNLRDVDRAAGLIEE